MLRQLATRIWSTIFASRLLNSVDPRSSVVMIAQGLDASHQSNTQLYPGSSSSDVTLCLISPTVDLDVENPSQPAGFTMLRHTPTSSQNGLDFVSPSLTQSSPRKHSGRKRPATTQKLIAVEIDNSALTNSSDYSLEDGTDVVDDGAKTDGAAILKTAHADHRESVMAKRKREQDNSGGLVDESCARDLPMKKRKRHVARDPDAPSQLPVRTREDPGKENPKPEAITESSTTGQYTQKIRFGSQSPAPGQKFVDSEMVSQSVEVLDSDDDAPAEVTRSAARSHLSVRKAAAKRAIDGKATRELQRRKKNEERLKKQAAESTKKNLKKLQGKDLRTEIAAQLEVPTTADASTRQNTNQALPAVRYGALDSKQLPKYLPADLLAELAADEGAIPSSLPKAAKAKKIKFRDSDVTKQSRDVIKNGVTIRVLQDTNRVLPPPVNRSSMGVKNKWMMAGRGNDREREGILRKPIVTNFKRQHRRSLRRDKRRWKAGKERRVQQSAE